MDFFRGFEKPKPASETAGGYKVGLYLIRVKELHGK